MVSSVFDIKMCSVTLGVHQHVYKLMEGLFSFQFSSLQHRTRVSSKSLQNYQDLLLFCETYTWNLKILWMVDKKTEEGCCITSKTASRCNERNKWTAQTHEHTKWPDVRLAAELAVFDDLRCRPLDGELGALGACVLIIKHESTAQRVDTHHYTAV